LNPAALPEGGIFQGRYQIVRCIKAGGMGAVYEVIHLETRRRRALKVMLPSMVASPEMRARFKLEATVAADIESEHIVETFDAGVDPETGAPFLVMELLRGQDLQRVLKRRRRLPPEETVLLLSQAALALDKTHAAGIVHRDLKPENLFLTQRDNGWPRLKLLDFGIAKVVAQVTQEQMATRSMGTPVYMSPEQIRGDGKLGPPADLYALGQIAYTLLVGEAYWAEESAALASVYPLLLRVTRGMLEPASARAWRRSEVALPAAFDGWFARATNLEEGERFGQASPMIAALGVALGVAGSWEAGGEGQLRAGRASLSWEDAAPAGLATPMSTPGGFSAPRPGEEPARPTPGAEPARAAPWGEQSALDARMLIVPGSAWPTPGGAEPVRPTPGGSEPARPMPWRAEPPRPTPGEAEPVWPTSGGAEPAWPTPGGAEPAWPTPGGAEPARSVGFGGTDVIAPSAGRPAISVGPAGSMAGSSAGKRAARAPGRSAMPAILGGLGLLAGGGIALAVFFGLHGRASDGGAAVAPESTTAGAARSASPLASATVDLRPAVVASAPAPAPSASAPPGPSSSSTTTAATRNEGHGDPDTPAPPRPPSEHRTADQLFGAPASPPPKASSTPKPAAKGQAAPDTMGF
jgi:eukaryotic-like serine/threonine-protein kinase